MLKKVTIRFCALLMWSAPAAVAQDTPVVRDLSSTQVALQPVADRMWEDAAQRRANEPRRAKILRERFPPLNFARSLAAPPRWPLRPFEAPCSPGHRIPETSVVAETAAEILESLSDKHPLPSLEVHRDRLLALNQAEVK